MQCASTASTDKTGTPSAVGSACFYDIKTGDLVAVEDWNGNYFSLDCAGPSECTPPACNGKWTYPACPDAAPEAAGGAGGAGGADAGGG